MLGEKSAIRGLPDQGLVADVVADVGVTSSSKTSLRRLGVALGRVLYIGMACVP